MNATQTSRTIHPVRVFAAALAALSAVSVAGCATHNPGTFVPAPVSLPPGNR